ncbi:MAG: hypothetical protein SFV51_18745 [Bryobacteraceae bacterium]|nr:hypothetical protein [Bryobacteraceae bacterium]
MSPPGVRTISLATDGEAVEPTPRMAGAPLFRALAAVLAFIQFWGSRHELNTDGVSYLDVGEAFFRGDWNVAINGMWSPLYPFLLGFTKAMLRPEAAREFFVVHLLNVAIFVGALAAFEYFLRSAMEWMSAEGQRVRRRTWTALGYGLFLWASLGLTGVGPVSPDLLASVFVYLGAGVVLKLRVHAERVRLWALLGVVLGVGYWARAPFLLWAPVFLVAAAWRRGGVNFPGRGLRVACGTLVLTALPLVVALSAVKGRPTFTDSGRLNYAWYVNGVVYRHWQGEPAGAGEHVAAERLVVPGDTGRPRHGTRKLLETPPVFAFGEPLRCTYAVWCDPSYWYEGVETAVYPGQQMRTLWVNMRELQAETFRVRPSESLRIFGIAAVLGLALGLYKRRRQGSWELVAIGCVGIVPHLFVRVEPRYVAAYLLVLLMGMFSFVRLSSGAYRWIGVFLLACAIPQHALVVVRTAAERPKELPVATAARVAGMGPGEPIAVLNYANIWHTKWAKLAGLRIVAEIHTSAFETSEDAFWHAKPESRKRVENAFRVAGAAYAVARFAPNWAAGEGWRRLGDTGYSVLPLGESRGEPFPPDTERRGRR